MAVTNFLASSPSAANSHDLTFGTNVTAGATILAFIRTGSTVTVTAAMNPLGSNTAMTAVGGAPVDNGAGRQYLFYLSNVAGGATSVRFSYNTSTAPRIGILEISDAIAVSFDVAASNTGTGTAADGGAAATSAQAANEVIGLFSAAANQTYAQSGSYSITGVEPAAGTSRLAIVHQTVNSIAAYTAAVTLGTSAAWIGQTAVFRITSGGGGGVSSSGAGHSGVRGLNADSSNRSVAETGRSGLRGLDALSSTRSVTETGRAGLHGQDAVSSTRSVTETGRLGLSGHNVSSTSLGVVSSGVGRVGMRGQCVAVKTALPFNVGGIGPTGQQVAGGGRTSSGTGRIGAHGATTTNITGSILSTGAGHMGVRGACVGVKAMTYANTGLAGVRGLASTAKSSSAPQSIGSMGLRGRSTIVETNQRDLLYTVGAPGHGWRIKSPRE